MPDQKTDLKSGVSTVLTGLNALHNSLPPGPQKDDVYNEILELTATQEKMWNKKLDETMAEYKKATEAVSEANKAIKTAQQDISKVAEAINAAAKLISAAVKLLVALGLAA